MPVHEERRLAEPVSTEPEPTRVLGIDETRRSLRGRTPNPPNAVLVVDHLHLLAKADDAVTKVRQRMT